MRRHVVRPYGLSVTPTRMLSLVMMAGLLWVAYGWSSNPVNWKWLADSHEQKQLEEAAEAAGGEILDDTNPEAGKLADAPTVPQEEIVAGPNDLDEKAAQEVHTKLKLVTDKAPLRPGEMPMYWDLMAWSRTESFADQKKRAKKGVPFSHLWEEPERFRGQLLHLRLHVRRVLKYDTEDNPLGLKECYEAWGWSDDSKSFPYVVVFPERPAGLPIGTDVRGEIEFTGYFLKIMSYTAFDVSRGAPLLIGRVKSVNKPAPPKPTVSDSRWKAGVAFSGFAVLVAIGVWNFRRAKAPKPVDLLPDELPPVDFENNQFQRPDLPVS